MYIYVLTSAEINRVAFFCIMLYYVVGDPRFGSARLRAVGEWDPNEPDPPNQVLASFPRFTRAGYPR
jgi:hypothetical protein